MVIKRVRPFSFGKMSAVIYGLFGLIAGGLISLVSLAGGLASMTQENGGMPAAFGMFFGIGAIILFPLCYAIFGFIGGVIGGALYNLAASMMGGLEIDVTP